MGLKLNCQERYQIVSLEIELLVLDSTLNSQNRNYPSLLRTIQVNSKQVKSKYFSNTSHSCVLLETSESDWFSVLVFYLLIDNTHIILSSMPVFYSSSNSLLK